MATLLSIISFVFLIMEILVGTVANGFIVFVNCIDWFRSKKLSPTDLILVCLGLSRLMWQALVMLHVTMVSFFLRTYISEQVHLSVVILWSFTETVNLWFAACLGVWYLTKIAIFSHPLFLQVKQRFSRLIPWLLLGSVVFSALMTIIAFARPISDLAICDPYLLLLNNSYDSEIQESRTCMDLVISRIVPNVIPSVIFLSSTVSLIISLWKHTRHLQHNGIGVRDLNTNVHLSAIKALASFAALYLSSQLAVSIQTMLGLGRNGHSWTSVLFRSISVMYSSGHAVILIINNPKLKQAWIRMIHHLKCDVCEAPS
ncbi:taste receptor type 2 member 1-like [Heteronotia binoei]|uniref:taste receptor type 2 member 1-like n=1 Tax=Heteronotia binoei TaxID=13085 RepID=UPI00292E1AD6|nr:taste receptor type 2 member 1-like [Heteronotia binoei]